MTVLVDWVERTLGALDLPKSVRAKLVNGEIVLVPVTGAHKTTARTIENQVQAGAPGWRAIGEFSVQPPRRGYAPEPDVSAVPKDVYRPSASSYDQSVLPFVVEVVSPESRRRDYKDKSTEYAARGIPVYLVVDVLHGRWALMSKPVTSGEMPEYASVVNGEFGEPIDIKAGDFTVTLDSSEFETFQ